MITDTASCRYPFYHSHKDTPERINFPALAQATEGIIKALLEQEQNL
jgi:hypothetical protein